MTIEPETRPNMSFQPTPLRAAAELDRWASL
jgi:hypothetical protein